MNFKIARHQLVVLAFAVISPVVISHAASQSSLGAVANTDRVAWAQSFLRAIYPDLNGKNLVATIETYVQYDKPGKPIDYWQLDVGEGTKDVPLGYSAGCLGHIIRPGDPPEKPLPSPGGRAPEPSQSSDCKPGPIIAKQYVSTGFGFDDDGTLRYYVLGNPSGRDAPKKNEFAALVRSHSDMTETEIADALKKLGAKFGPYDKDALEKKLPLAELSPLIGKLRLISLSFEPLAKNRQTDESWPQWKAKVETISHGHQKLTYEMTFDRFNGDLISMNRLDLH